jgi:hypothetical protein
VNTTPRHTYGYGAMSRAEIWEAVMAARERDDAFSTASVWSAQNKAEELRELSWFYSVSRCGGAG